MNCRDVTWRKVSFSALRLRGVKVTVPVRVGKLMGVSDVEKFIEIAVEFLFRMKYAEKPKVNLSNNETL